MAIWDHGEGFSGGHESPAAYERFKRFLEMGPTRNVRHLAASLGITEQSLGQVAKRYNWRERASAWDRRDEPEPRKPPKIKPAVPEAPAPPPSPAVTDQPIEPEVLGRVASKRSGVSQSHRESLSRYRQVYESIGHGMAVEACQVFPIAKAMRESIGRGVEASSALHDAGEHEAAMRILSQMDSAVRSYMNLTNVLHAYANGGRMHWGDAIGVHRIMEEVWGKRK